MKAPRKEKAFSFRGFLQFSFNALITDTMESRIFNYKDEFHLERGGTLPELTLQYHTAGKFDPEKNNVIWAFHALTANSDVFDWWHGLFGNHFLFNPDDYFIICVNVPGSCYGSTGPLSIHPGNRQPWYHGFPSLTVRDFVKAFDLLREHLEIQQIHTAIGGSLGGQQALEWSIMRPDLIENLILISTSAKMAPWAIAFSETQRMAIQSDPSWKDSTPEAGLSGLKTARSIALLSYRNAVTYNTTQAETSDTLPEHHKSETYQRYQGEKLATRFNSFSYMVLSKALDSHNIGRGRAGVRQALRKVKANTLVIGIDTDILFPASEQKYLATYIPRAKYKEIGSLYGHDGFLIETEKISSIAGEFLSEARPVLRLNEAVA